MCSHAFRKILGLDRVPRTQSHISDLESPTSSNNEITTPAKITQDDFECICPLGRGKFGSVVLVSKRDTNKKYAMKVVKKASVLDGGRVKDLFSERSVLKRAKHPFIVKLDWTFQSEHKLFFVMEYLEGGDLATYLNNVPNKRFELDKAKFYAGEVWEALNYLHENDVIYRDLKPENILLDIKGHACLSDFGLSKDFQCTDINPEQRCDSFVGSPFYVAPDVLRQQKYGKAVDWWSFGVLLYRMLTGVVPFGGKNMRQVFEAVLHRKPDLTPYTWLTEETKDLILKLLKKDEFSRLDGPGVHRHVFFNGLDWQKLKTKEMDPPGPAFVPPKNCNSLLFRTEEVQRSPPGALGSAQQRLFDGFTYIGSTNNLKPTT